MMTRCKMHCVKSAWFMHCSAIGFRLLVCALWDPPVHGPSSAKDPGPCTHKWSVHQQGESRDLSLLELTTHPVHLVGCLATWNRYPPAGTRGLPEQCPRQCTAQTACVVMMRKAISCIMDQLRGLEQGIWRCSSPFAGSCDDAKGCEQRLTGFGCGCNCLQLREGK